MNTHSVPSTLLHGIFFKIQLHFDSFYRKYVSQFLYTKLEEIYPEVITDPQPQNPEAWGTQAPELFQAKWN